MLFKNNLQCLNKDCPLYDLYLKGWCVEYEGNTHQPDLYLIGMCPASEEVKQKRPFVGKSGQLLRQVLQKYNIENIRIANVVKCYVKPRQPLPVKAKNLCKKFLLEDIKRCNPKIIMPLGNDAFRVLFPDTSVSITEVWDTKLYYNKTIVIPNVHPSYVLENLKSDDVIFKKFKHTIERAKTVLQNYDKYKHKVIPQPQIHFLFTLSEINQFLNKAKRYPVISLDIETYRNQPYFEDSLLYTISIATKDFVFVFPVEQDKSISDKVKELLKEFLLNNNQIKVMHNALYECIWFYHRLGIVLKNIADTMLMSHSVYFGSIELHGLKFIMKYRFGVKDWAKDLTDIRKIDLKELMEYNAYDSYYTLYLYNHFGNLFKNMMQSRSFQCKQYIKYYTTIVKPLLFKLIPVLAKNVVDGIYPSYENIETFEKQLLNDMAKCIANIYTDKDLLAFDNKTRIFVENYFYSVFNKDKNEFGKFLMEELGIVDNKMKNKKLDIFNINSLQQLYRFLKYKDNNLKLPLTEKGNPSLSKDVLAKIKGNKVITNLLKLRELQKKYSTYVKKVREIAYDGKMHPDWFLINESTSRFASHNPNCQNFPKRAGKELRNLIKAPDGYIILDADFSALEVRGEAIISKDKALKQFLVSGNDMHLYYSELIFGKEKAKEMRNKVKNGFVFPLLYGAGVKTILSNLGLSQKHRKRIHEMMLLFFQKHEGIKKNHHEKMNEYYDRYFEIYDMCGRTRKCPISYTMRMNYPIQSSSFYFTILAWTYLLNCGFWSPMEIHDEIFMYVKEDNNEITKAINYIHFAMTQLPVLYFEEVKRSGIPVEIEMKRGYYFGSLEEFDYKNFVVDSIQKECYRKAREMELI